MTGMKGWEPAPVPPELVEFIQTGSSFIVAGHKEPDGDCVGSQLALCSVLRRLGKKAIPCSAGPFKRTEIRPYESRFAPVPPDRAGARVVVVDCSAPDRTGDLAPLLEGLPAAFIDHHAVGALGGAFSAAEGQRPVVFLDPGAPSTTALVTRLIAALGLAPNPEEAEMLLFGLCTDTGFFRHIDEGGAETFDCAAALIRAGASPKKVFQAIHGGKSLNSRILMGNILSRAESHFGGRLILSREEYEETARFGLEGRDSDSLYQLLQSVAGVEAIVIIRQESPENCSVGFRSRDTVDVAAVAAAFGGGGHKNAAGALVPGRIDSLALRILAAFEEIFR
ncbi:MAG: bifunctional oligoribonuclease/PAP phosphatase NrnA [Treponema sp.]|jgi:phosphoesterase RecJ-like protein|nr:bifunctional oligoribonuclease/PAP phosphatase NrnA [Treponema sp.]